MAPPAGLGIRNAVVIVSPYARPAYTDSNVATTASLLAFTEHTFGLNPLGAADGSAYNYSNAFDFTQTPFAPVRLTRTPIPEASLVYLQTHRATPLIRPDRDECRPASASHP